MTEIMICGDWHGDTRHVRKVIKKAHDMGIKTIMQVGDFGIWTHHPDGVTFLDVMNEECRKWGVKVYFVGGNHENWDHLDWHEKNGPKTYAGLTILRSHIRYTGRVKRWSVDGKVFQAVGGAVSIDKGQPHRKPGVGWWSQEAIPERVVYGLEQAGRRADYLLTHDAPSCAPFKRLKDDPESTAHRQLMNRIGRVVQPKLWFHGHYHTWMENYPFMHQTGYTSCYGLDMNGDYYHYVILDTETNAVHTATGKINIYEE